jgi:sugar/nucleoside kinase (ribokinase family)
MFDVCVIGQIVKDYNYLKGKKYPPKISAGGAGYYSTYTYYNLGLKTALVTSFNKNDKYLLSRQFDNIKIINNNNATSTEFRNYYRLGDKNYRKQEATYNNRPVKNKIPKAKIYHFGPLVPNDINYILYNKIKKRKGLKILDVQGLTRDIKNQIIINQINPSIKKLLKGFDVLKCDTRELFLMKDYKKKESIVNYLFDLGISEIIVTKGFFGSTIYSKEKDRTVIPPFIPNKIVDTTGCGDTYAAIYAFARYKGYSIYHAGLLASAGSGIKTEKTGLLTKSFTKIKIRVNPICQI